MHPLIDNSDVELLRSQGMSEEDVAHSVAVAGLALDIAGRVNVPLDMAITGQSEIDAMTEAFFNGDCDLLAKRQENPLPEFHLAVGDWESAHLPAATGQWRELAVDVQGDTVTGLVDGKPYIVHHFDYAPKGLVGVWSKADSVVEFSELRRTDGQSDLVFLSPSNREN
jgi:hypothetical protein